MAALNKVMIIGNLGRDPEVRATPNGTKVSTFSVAATEKFKDNQGNTKEKTEWVNVVFWGRQAEICEQYLRKGSSVYVEGKLQTTSWEDSNGLKKYKTEVLGLTLQMLGGKPSESQGSSGYQGGGYQSQNYQSGGFQGSPEVIEDDLPF